MKYWDRRRGHGKKETIVLKDGKIKNINFSDRLGQSIRSLKNGVWAFYSNGGTNTKKTNSLLEGVGDGSMEISEGSKYVEDVHDDFKLHPFKVKKERKVRDLKELYRSIKNQNSKVVSVTINLMSSITEGEFKNNFNSNITKEKIQTAINVVVTIKEDGEVQRSFWHKGKRKGYEMVDTLNKRKIANETVDKALKLLRANSAPPGRYPVILDPELAGVFFHEAVGHACEADLHIEDASILKNRLGEEIASDKVTLIDDPSIKNSRGSITFDDEGEKARKTVMIKNGVLSNLLHSRETASRMNQEPTGNGRASSVANFQIPRMTNTILEPGDHSLEETIEKIDKGVYLKGSAGGQVETTKGNFLFNAEIGYLIKDGEIKEPVRDVSLAGNILKILKRVNAVGEERETAFRWGFCGKKGQRVPVDESCPFISVEEAILGGRGS